MTPLSSSRLGRRRGMVAVQVSLCLTVLMGVAAVTRDGGLLLVERERAQAVAEAGAHCDGSSAGRP